MMKKFDRPKRSQWADITKRPSLESADLDKKVRKILSKVKEKGDKAVRRYTRLFDGVAIKKLAVSPKEMERAVSEVDDALREAIHLAAGNIRAFHALQLPKQEHLSTMPGVQCWRKAIPLQTVGIYIPGGTAPLFSSVLMLGIPAMLAGCPEIVLCSPPGKDGRIHPAILYTASYLGIRKVFACGGVQAIAAMAYGTEAIPKVDKIFGPGNQYVTCAKQLVQREGVAIDLPAGPSEVAVYADETARPSFVAADLLSQAEHGRDSQVVLVTSSEETGEKVMKEIQQQVQKLSRKEIAAGALSNSKWIIVPDRKEAMDFLNAYAPEHLILSCRDAREYAEQVLHAGSVFIGNYSPESAGDYASGTNHTLPTGGNAKGYSGVSVDSFFRKVTFQELSSEGLQAIGAAVTYMAEAEGLQAHAEAIRIRLNG